MLRPTSVRNCIQVDHPSRCRLHRCLAAALARALITTSHSRLNRALPAEASAPRCRSHPRRPAVAPSPRFPLRHSGPCSGRPGIASPLKRRSQDVTLSTVARAASVGRMLFHVVRLRRAAGVTEQQHSPHMDDRIWAIEFPPHTLNATSPAPRINLQC